MKKRVLAVILGAAMITAGLAGCGGNTGSSSGSSEGEEMYTIGISQFCRAWLSGQLQGRIYPGPGRRRSGRRRKSGDQSK